MLLVDTDISASVHGFASTVSVLQIHHLPELNIYFHYNLRSICHSHLLFADSKQHNMWLMHPAYHKSTLAHLTWSLCVCLYVHESFWQGKWQGSVDKPEMLILVTWTQWSKGNLQIRFLVLMLDCFSFSSMKILWEEDKWSYPWESPYN